MNTKNNGLFMFAVGALVGSAVTWLVMSERYKRMEEEEFEDDDDLYYVYGDTEPIGDVSNVDEDDEGVHFTLTNVKPNIMEYTKKIQEQGYVDYSNTSKPAKNSKEVDDVEKPYVIPPEEFDELDYKTISLTYYADDVLTDEEGNVIEDVDDTVGPNSLGTFGEYEMDSVFVRDDRRKIDYEILADERKYSDVFETNPHLAEGE